MTAATESGAPATPRKPRISFLIATAFGLGYLKPGPGTWGSLAGVLISTIFLLGFRCVLHFTGLSVFTFFVGNETADFFVSVQILLSVAIGAAGVWTAGRVEAYSGKHDPQYVVIDEVSGQQLTLLLGGFVGRRAYPGIQGILWANHPLATIGAVEPNWKYLLLGFILFRVFDIWKPFPARQAESLPGGWGIMADDWVAAIYAAAGLWIARSLGL
jgi:phosphatidylglycerophosphatase A